MIDNITGGRLIAGFVRGIGAEYHSWNMNPAFSHERFHEAHDLIVRAWTETGPVSLARQALRFPLRQHVAAAVPATAPADLDSVAGQPRDDRLGGGGRTQVHLPANLQPGRQRSRNSSTCIARKRSKAGYTATPEQLGWMAPVYVGETDASARAEAKPHIEAFANKFLRMKAEMVRPPGYLSLASAEAVLEAKSGADRRRTHDRSADRERSVHLRLGRDRARPPRRTRAHARARATSSRCCSSARCRTTRRCATSNASRATSSPDYAKRPSACHPERSAMGA